MRGFAHHRFTLRDLGTAASLLAVLVSAVTSRASVGTTATIFSDGFESGGTEKWTCANLQCLKPVCGPSATTSVSGVVHAPNGTLPIPNAVVYVPNLPLEPLPAGAQCSLCATPPPGNPVALTTTASDGSFEVDDMPASVNVPLVIQVGKWRRQITIPHVTACANTPVDPSATRLPKNHSEGELPLIAVSTGAADALECLVRKVGIDDSEFTTSSGGGRVHLYAGGGGTPAFDAAHGSQAFTASTSLWASSANLSAYDIVLLSCEGQQLPDQKPQSARNAMKAYADAGGRVFAEHWHNYWLQSGPTAWATLATWNFLSDLPAQNADVNQSLARGADMAHWLVTAGASANLGKMPTPTPTKQTATAVDEAKAGKWIYESTTTNGYPTVQYFSFTTPVENAQASRCGRVVFSDMHAVGGDTSGTNLKFPSGGCVSPVDSMTPQEKLTAFMLFDIGTCTGSGVE